MEGTAVALRTRFASVKPPAAGGRSCPIRLEIVPDRSENEKDGEDPPRRDNPTLTPANVPHTKI
jgi:hypothetical protein